MITENVARTTVVTASGSVDVNYVPDSGNLYYGALVNETGGVTAGEVRFYDGTDSTGTLLDSLSTAAGALDRSFVDVGIFLSTGLYVEVVSGTVEVTVFHS